MAWKERLHEDFSSGLGDLLSDAGNGSIAVSGGQLVLSTPLGANCNWWTSAYSGAPSIYREFSRYKVSGSGIYMVELYHASHDKLSGTNESVVLACIEKTARYDYYLMQNYWENTDYWNIGKIIGDVWIDNWSGDWSNRYRPGWIRLYVNGSGSRIWLPDSNVGWMAPGSIGLAFSTTRSDWTDDIWVYSAPELLTSIDALRFRFVKKTYGSYPQTEAKFEDLYVYEWEDVELKLEGHPDDPEGGSTRAAGVSDAAAYDIGDAHELRTQSGAEAPRVEERTAPIKAGVDDAANYALGGPTVPQQRQGNLLDHAGAYIIGDTDAQPGDKSRIKPTVGITDEMRWSRGSTVQFRQDTLDPYAHAHFSGLKPLAMFYYRTDGEPWASPSVGGFTGYARNGDHYTGGVVDPGPVVAPWAQEATFPSGNRSPRKDFPVEALLVVTSTELVIFDLDNWPTTLSVWMRFESGVNYGMIGQGSEYVSDVSMANGTLVVALKYVGSSYGGVSIIDFKNDGSRHCAHLIRSDGHWWWTSGLDIRNRNEASRWQTDVPISLRINPEYMYSVSIYDDHNGKSWVACGGEDQGPQVVGLESGQPKWVGTANGPAQQMGTDNVGDTRQVLFDESGWLWYSIENRLYRCMFDYKGGVLIANQANRLQRGVTFKNETIRCLAQGRNFVYVGTDRGVYRVHKGSLKANLAYTIVGGGGGGLLDNPPDGEVLAGTSPYIKRLQCISTDKSSILQVVTRTGNGILGGVTTIRLTDDFIITSETYPNIPEDYIFVGASSIGA